MSQDGTDDCLRFQLYHDPPSHIYHSNATKDFMLNFKLTNKTIHIKLGLVYNTIISEEVTERLKQQ